MASSRVLRARPQAVLLAAVATIVCVRAATAPTGGSAQALTDAAADPSALGSVPVMVSISGPLEIQPHDEASVGTAVHLVTDGKAITGTMVVLDRRIAGARDWVEVARGTTDAAGRAVFRLRVARNIDLRAKTVGDPKYAAASSAVITVASP